MASSIYMGLMSGTSMDGVDAVLADFGNPLPRVLAHTSQPYPADLLQTLRQATTQASTAAQWLQLDARLGQHFGQCAQQCLQQSGLKAAEVSAIGSHGQTVWHAPKGSFPNSWQLGDPNRIVAATGISVVADFRRADIADGGQGAPFAPAFHDYLFRDTQESRAVVNLGGIANITLLKPAQPTLGFDTGPANTLLDAHCRLVLNQPYDDNGDWAAKGNVNPALLARLLSDEYFQQAPPKSTGPEHFNWQWLEKHLAQQPCEGADLQATLLALTAASIAQQLQGVERVIACGGGIRNQALMQLLASKLTDAKLETSNHHGVDAQQMEALAFAWLAEQRVEHRPVDLSSITGASQANLLGGLYLAR